MTTSEEEEEHYYSNDVVVVKEPATERSPFLKNASPSPQYDDDDDYGETTAANQNRHEEEDAADDDPDGRKKRKKKAIMWGVMPALAIGVFLFAADQTIVVSTYGKIGSEMQALNNTSWIATAYVLAISSPFKPQSILFLSPRFPPQTFITDLGNRRYIYIYISLSLTYRI